jgi:16S rRNA U516 pseudouridylate synthase RsuA-like enzyme
LYKPVGITCHQDTMAGEDKHHRLPGLPAARLPDRAAGRDSEGLIFLTNDGDIVNPDPAGGKTITKRNTA